MRRLILSAGLSVGLLLSPVAGFAQTPHTAAAAPAAPSAHATDLARRYIKAMRMEEAMTVVFSQFDPLMGMDPSMAAKIDRNAMREAMVESVGEILPKWTEALIPYVAAAFSVEELEAMVAFYESPIGQSVVTKSQVLAKPSMEIMQDLAPGLGEDMLARYCAKATCTGALKDQLKKQPS
ncbi:DUF2059 domain-containing protein [Caulobacter sp. NIBR1757]|uniref:DUF2059 domain-containing protein n=1 Tax=Caulobacter sp. NIBR1757 TaxID=3016000 RepID=UPI0022F03C64|nr:DUF2059 domain-containing protein [Caulobacter sp. NIBR1757]WGM39171.1 hypothetical protein AMEJIAPC_02086 [Caulobacter sp. NIBR1757]